MGGRGSNGKASSGAGGSAQAQSIPKSHVRVDGESAYEFSTGYKPRGMGNWAFKIGSEEKFIYGSYSDAKKEAISYAASKGISSIKVLT